MSLIKEVFDYFDLPAYEQLHNLYYRQVNLGDVYIAGLISAWLVSWLI